MKSIAFISIAFILIMIITTQLFPRKTPCLSQNVYYGTPGLVREGFTKASSYAHCYNANTDDGADGFVGNSDDDEDETVLNNYPYFKATHVPTNFAVEQQEAINIFNNKVSRHSAVKPDGNIFTMQYGCRKSPITYNSDSYKYCGAWSYNACNVPRNM